MIFTYSAGSHGEPSEYIYLMALSTWQCWRRLGTEALLVRLAHEDHTVIWSDVTEGRPRLGGCARDMSKSKSLVSFVA
jgi:hypothetical protein